MRAYLAQIFHQIKTMCAQITVRVLAIPAWRWRVYAAVFVASLLYLLWSRYGSSPSLPTGQSIQVQPARAVAKMERKAVTPQQLIVYRDKVRVVERLGLPPSSAADPKEEISSTADLPRLKYGGVAATFTNILTGQSRTEIKAKAAPWFSLEKGNEVALGYGLSTKGGQTAHFHYRRDLFQVKGAYISVKQKSMPAQPRKARQ